MVETIYAIDFEYDGRRLSEFDFIICSFDENGGARTAEKGTEVTFSTAPIGLGQRHAVTGTRFDTRLSTSFQICKDPEKYNEAEMYITNEEFRELSRWLNRRKFLWFHACDDCEPEIQYPWFRATFSLKRINTGPMTVGIQLDMQTDAPWGYGEEIEEHFVFTPDNMVNIIEDKNEEVGTIWPDMIITCNDDGDLTLTNELTGCVFRIRNCTKNEVVTQYGDIRIIESKKRITNLLKLPGSDDYVAGKDTAKSGHMYHIDSDGVITIDV